VLIQFAQAFLAYVGDFAGYLFRPQIGIAGFKLMFFDVYRVNLSFSTRRELRTMASSYI
jgi:hypothetical protein